MPARARPAIAVSPRRRHLGTVCEPPVGRRALRCGARRLLADHSGVGGSLFTTHYRALDQRLGPFTDPLLRDLASAASAVWVEWQRSVADLDRARDVRTNGKGRRPNAQAIQRLQKRVGLAQSDYLTLLAKLEALCATRKGQTLAERLSRRATPPAGEHTT
jgi:hypothetical protein